MNERLSFAAKLSRLRMRLAQPELSPTTWHGTRPAKASACPGRSSPPSPMHATARALQQHSPDGPRPVTATPRTPKPLRPSQSGQVGPASLLAAELRLQFRQVPGVDTHLPGFFSCYQGWTVLVLEFR